MLSGSLIAALASRRLFLVSTTTVTQLERVHPEVLLMAVMMLLGLVLLPLSLGLRSGATSRCDPGRRRDGCRGSRDQDHRRCR